MIEIHVFIVLQVFDYLQLALSIVLYCIEARGQVDRALDSSSEGLGFNSQHWSCVKVSGFHFGFRTTLVHRAIMGTWRTDPRLDQWLLAALVPTLIGERLKSVQHVYHGCLDYKQLCSFILWFRLWMSESKVIDEIFQSLAPFHFISHHQSVSSFVFSFIALHWWTTATIHLRYFNECTFVSS